MDTTDNWSARLSEYVDGALDPRERVQLETHLAECEDCRRAVDELRAVVARAGMVEDGDPPRDLWPGISERIRASSVVPIAEGRRRRGRVFTFSMPQLAAAAAVVAFIGAGAMWLLVPATPDDLARGPASSDALVAPAAATVEEPAVASIIEELQHVLEEHRSDLDTATVRVLEENLAIVDRAIAEARTALLGDPANQFLNTHLAETLRLKVQLLRQAASLVTAAS